MRYRKPFNITLHELVIQKLRERSLIEGKSASQIIEELLIEYLGINNLEYNESDDINRILNAVCPKCNHKKLLTLGDECKCECHIPKLDEL